MKAIAVAFLIQAQQILPVTALGVALAPEFIFKAQKRRKADPLGEIPSAPPPPRTGLGALMHPHQPPGRQGNNDPHFSFNQNP